MNETLARRVRMGYGIFLSVFTAVLAILFIVGVADIYFTDVPAGTAKYSREIVGEHLTPLMIVMAIWIVAIIAGYVLSVMLPETKKRKGALSPSVALKRLRPKIPDGKSEEFLAEKKRFDRMTLVKIIIWSACAAFAVASAIVAIVYLAGGRHFDTANGNFNQLVVRMVGAIGPWILVSFLLFVGATLYEYFTAKKELAIAKQLLVLGKGSEAASRSAISVRKDQILAAVGKPKVKLALRIAVLTIAIAFIIIGNLPINQGKVWFAGFEEVMNKAVNICTECIGLG